MGCLVVYSLVFSYDLARRRYCSWNAIYLLRMWYILLFTEETENLNMCKFSQSLTDSWKYNPVCFFLVLTHCFLLFSSKVPKILQAWLYWKLKHKLIVLYFLQHRVQIWENSCFSSLSSLLLFFSFLRQQKPFILQAFNLQTNKSNYLFIHMLNYAAFFNVSAVLNWHDCFKIVINTSLCCDCLGVETLGYIHYSKTLLTSGLSHQ